MICLEIKTANLTKMFKTAIFNLKKVNLKSLRDKKEIYGGIGLWSDTHVTPTSGKGKIRCYWM